LIRLGLIQGKKGHGPRAEILELKRDYVRVDNRFIILSITENNTSRAVSINDTLYRILSEIPRKGGDVFGNENGGHIGDIEHSFTLTCRKAGITDCRLPDLRGTYANHLAMRGVHIGGIKGIAGLKDIGDDPALLSPYARAVTECGEAVEPAEERLPPFVTSFSLCPWLRIMAPSAFHFP
jgi:integrase